jgi:hypothetical protein
MSQKAIGWMLFWILALLVVGFVSSALNATWAIYLVGGGALIHALSLASKK